MSSNGECAAAEAPVSDLLAAADGDVDSAAAQNGGPVFNVKQESEAAAADDGDCKASKEDKANVKAVEAISEEERYKKLMDLLGKSKFYSEFLLKKMQDEDEAHRLKEKMAEDRKRKRDQDKNDNDKDEKKNKRGRGRGRGRQSKARAEEQERQKQKEQMEASKKRKREEDDTEDDEDEKKVAHASRTFDGEEIPDEQPLLLSGGVMRDYQVKGYQWMATLFENGINGILADEMGLGKTIQTIALFCHLVEMGVAGPFLIVAPLSTVPNWVKEFK